MIEFFSFIPPQMFDLTRLMGRKAEDVTTDEAFQVLRPDFEKFDAGGSVTSEGDLICEINVSGDARLDTV